MNIKKITEEEMRILKYKIVQMLPKNSIEEYRISEVLEKYIGLGNTEEIRKQITIKLCKLFKCPYDYKVESINTV